MGNTLDINQLPFELAYLALLTRYHLKPLSRWEGELSPAQISTLNRLGLEVEPVRRHTLLGKCVPRSVFSMNARYIETYRSKFEGKRLKATPSVTKEAVRAERAGSGRSAHSFPLGLSRL